MASEWAFRWVLGRGQVLGRAPEPKRAGCPMPEYRFRALEPVKPARYPWVAVPRESQMEERRFRVLRQREPGVRVRGQGRALVPSLLGSNVLIPSSPKRFRWLGELPTELGQPVRLWQMAIPVGVEPRSIDRVQEDWPPEQPISEQPVQQRE